MPGLYSVYKVFSSGEILTAADLNNCLTQYITDAEPIYFDDYSVDVATYHSVTTPSHSTLPTTLAGELQHLRGAIKRILGETNWDDVPDKDIVTSAADIIALQTPTINEQTDSYQLLLTDAGKWIDMNKGSANTLTVPAFITVGFPVGTTILVRQMGAGATTIAAAATVTINTTTGLILDKQHAVACLFKLATNTWIAFGALKT